jgi:hypothetical protein
MFYELPIRNKPAAPYRHKRFYEADGNKVKIWGKCEVTGRYFEMFAPTDEFYAYLQGNMIISKALKSVPAEEREFLLSGTSPEGWKVLFPPK